MKEKFLISVMVREPAEGSPGESVQDAVLSDEAPDRNVVGGISINWRRNDVEMYKTGYQRIDN